MSESTGIGHQVPDSTSLSTPLATKYNETTVPGTGEIALSTKVPIENTIALGGQVEDTMASQKRSVCGPLSSPAESGDVPQPLFRCIFYLMRIYMYRLCRYTHSYMYIYICLYTNVPGSAYPSKCTIKYMYINNQYKLTHYMYLCIMAGHIFSMTLSCGATAVAV